MTNKFTVTTDDAQTLTNKTFDGTSTFPNFNQSTTGNAATATKLATARNINGVPFDGTAAVEVTEVFVPSDYSYIAWNYDPVKAFASANLPTAGQAYLMALPIRSACTITNVVLNVITAGSGLTSGESFAGLFDHSGNLLSATADQSTNWTSAGKKVMSLTAPQSVTPGMYYVGFFVGGGTTLPKFSYDNAAAASIAANGQFSTAPRAVVDTTNTGLTTAFHSPATLTVASGAVGIYWAAVS